MSAARPENVDAGAVTLFGRSATRSLAATRARSRLPDQQAGCPSETEGWGLPFVRADEFGRREHVPRDRLLQVDLSCTRRELEFLVQGVEAENVAVAPVPRRRARSTVADRSEVVSPLAGRPLPLRLAQPACAWVESPRDPVREDATRRVRVGDEQRQRSRLVRDVCHRSGGERSSPSQVYRVGIACAWSKAVLSRAKPAISR
jgi:hypothetical protein